MSSVSTLDDALYLALAAEGVEFTILSAAENVENATDGTLRDVLEVTFELIGRPGLFTVRVPRSTAGYGGIEEAVYARTQEILQVYGF